MHIWRTLRNLVLYRSLFAAAVDREMRRRLGHGETHHQNR